MSRRGRTALVLTASLFGVLAVSVLSVALGSREVSLAEVVRALTDPSAAGIAEAAVRERVPRTVLGLIVGASLGLAGAGMQGVTRNPLADPGILGINSGAALAVVAALAFAGSVSTGQLLWVALGGAALAAVLVYAVGSAGRGGATPLKLALAGAAITAVFSSLTSAILLPRAEIVTLFRFWQIGSIGSAEPESLLSALPFLGVGAALVLSSARALNALALGDELARGLGERVQLARFLAASGTLLLAAAATALAGPIAFVGLVVPHLARLLFGSDYRSILPLSVGFGAILLVAADVLGRVLARPTDIEVGITLALVGAPVFIAIARRRRIAEL